MSWVAKSNNKVCKITTSAPVQPGSQSVSQPSDVIRSSSEVVRSDQSVIKDCREVIRGDQSVIRKQEPYNPCPLPYKSIHVPIINATGLSV
jgi:hypothetical protein